MKVLIPKFLIITLITATFFTIGRSQDNPDWEGSFPDGCTTITVGKLATADGSVITSHTDDSHRTRSWIDIRESQKHPEGARARMFKRMQFDSLVMPAYIHREIGSIPQVPGTYGFINTAYPCMQWPYRSNNQNRQS